MDDQVQMLGKLLDATALRQRALANNIANVETPRYKRQDVYFSDALAKAMESKSRTQVANFNPKITDDTVSVCRPDGNNVSLQKELGDMAENQLVYNFATRAVQRKYATLRKAIKGR